MLKKALRLIKLNSRWLFLAGLVIFLVIFMAGCQTVKLTCERTSPGGTVNCFKESKLFWLIPSGTGTIRDVRGAQLGESSYEDSATYRAELITGQGVVPLTSVYTSGYMLKKDVVNQINGFVDQRGNHELIVTEPGLLSLENAMYILIWIALVAVYLLLRLIWEGIKSVFRWALGKSVKDV